MQYGIAEYLEEAKAEGERDPIANTVSLNHTNVVTCKLRVFLWLRVSHESLKVVNLLNVLGVVF